MMFENLQAQHLIDGEYFKSLQCYQQLLKITNSQNSQDALEAAHLNDKLAFLHNKLGQFHQALECCNTSLSLKLKEQTIEDDFELIENYKQLRYYLSRSRKI